MRSSETPLTAEFRWKSKGLEWLIRRLISMYYDCNLAQCRQFDNKINVSVVLCAWYDSAGVIGFALGAPKARSLVRCVIKMWVYHTCDHSQEQVRGWLWETLLSPGAVAEVKHQIAHVNQYSLPLCSIMRLYKIMEDNKAFQTATWRHRITRLDFQCSHHSAILPGSIRRKCWVSMSISDSARIRIIRMCPGHLHSFRPTLCLTTWLNTLPFPCIYI